VYRVEAVHLELSTHLKSSPKPVRMSIAKRLDAGQFDTHDQYTAASREPQLELGRWEGG
jgi:hypothetical protein